MFMPTNKIITYYQYGWWIFRYIQFDLNQLIIIDMIIDIVIFFI